MKLIESKAEYIPQEEGLEGIYKQVELAGRTAYHSLDKITPDSAKDFVDRMIKSKHGACLEHSTVYLAIPITEWHSYEEYSYGYLFNPYSRVNDALVDWEKWEGIVYITTNYRVLTENNWLDDLQYLCSPTEFHEKRYTMRFTCSRAIANELVRHRVFSFLQESTRYINYSKDKHGGEVTFIKPSWANVSTNLADRTMITNDLRAWENTNYIHVYCKDIKSKWFMKSCLESEYCYLSMIHEQKATPQQARDVLPNATKTKLIMTGFSSDWRFLMDLRLFEKTGRVHPDMKDLMQKAQRAMQDAGIWGDIMSYPSKFE